MSTMTNGRVRKSLAEQIDRLDAILDGLSENLNEAVVSAVKEAVAVAVQEAVRGVLTELLTNAGFLELVRATVVAPETTGAAKPSRASKLFGHAKNWLFSRREQVRKAVPVVLLGLRVAATRLKDRWAVIRRYRKQLLVALGVGTAAGVLAYVAGPYVAAAAGWVGGFAATLAVQAGLALRKLAAAVGDA